MSGPVPGGEPGPAFRRPRFPWHHFTAASGPAGRSWAALYRAPGALQIRDTARAALLHLRHGEEEAGREALERAAAGVDELDGPASLRSIHQRWYYGARAYYHYACGDLGLAGADLDRAEGALRAAIDEDRFLLPAAQEFPDFPHQRTRIARNRRRWKEMLSQIDVERAMMAGTEPLCSLSDGVEVSYPSLEGYLRSLEGLSAEEHRYLDEFLDVDLRLRSFEQGIRRLLASSGVPVPYP